MVGFLCGGHHAVYLCLVVLREWHFDRDRISMALGQHSIVDMAVRADFRPIFHFVHLLISISVKSRYNPPFMSHFDRE